jgi:hypothetical protein
MPTSYYDPRPIREILFLFLGGASGHIVGWIIAIGWGIHTGFLVTPKPEWFLILIFYGLIGICTILGGLIGWIRFGRQSRRRWVGSHENAPPIGGWKEAMPQFFKRRVRLILIGVAAIVASFFLLNWLR